MLAVDKRHAILDSCVGNCTRHIYLEMSIYNEIQILLLWYYSIAVKNEYHKMVNWREQKKKVVDAFNLDHIANESNRIVNP